MVRHPAEGRLQPCQSAEGRRQADRAAGVGAQCGRSETGRNSNAGTAARATGYAVSLKVPRVPRGTAVLVGAPATQRKFYGLGFTQDDRTFACQAIHHGSRDWRHPAIQGTAAPRGRLTLDLNDVLESKGYPMQGTERFSCRTLPV